jgi:hypothetical protein
MDPSRENGADGRPGGKAIHSSLTVAVAARIAGAAEQRRHPMKRFMFGLLASGLLTLGLAGAPAKVEAAPPQTAIYQAAAQTVQPAKSQYWRRGWYGPRWGGYWYAPSRAYYYGGYYPYRATYYYSTPYYYSAPYYYSTPYYSGSYAAPYYGGYYTTPSYYGSGYSYYTPGVGVWVY